MSHWNHRKCYCPRQWGRSVFGTVESCQQLRSYVLEKLGVFQSVPFYAGDFQIDFSLSVVLAVIQDLMVVSLREAFKTVIMN